MESGKLLVPDYCEPITGWRYWRINADILLESRGKIWEPLKAKKVKHEHFLETFGLHVSCIGFPVCPNCGIHAFKTKQQIEEYIDFMMNVVIGEVYLWGKIVEHERGYRAEFAYPKRIYGPKIFDEIKHTYKVEYQIEGRKIWTSVGNYENLQQNHWYTLYPTQGTWMGINRTISPQITSQFPGKTWTSQWLLHPNVWSPIIKPKFKLEQPSFNIHKPTKWWKDSKTGLWMRTE